MNRVITLHAIHATYNQMTKTLCKLNNPQIRSQAFTDSQQQQKKGKFKWIMVQNTNCQLSA